MSDLAAGDYNGAVEYFEKAGTGLTEDNDCGLRFFRLTARYLAAYSQTPPLFPHFNGGFYTYLKDSLFWSDSDSLQYEMALSAVMDLVQWTNAKNPLYLELLGDMITGHRDRFYATYFAWMAYERAGIESEGSAATAFERKAIFALEFPGTNEDRFNRYRYTQLNKALREDLASAPHETRGPEPPLPRWFFPSQSNAHLFGMLKKAQSQEIARRSRVLKFDQEVNRRDVKRDTRFNAYALFLIAVIIGSVIFFWIKLKRAAKTR
jgi:hypothetical protein